MKKDDAAKMKELKEKARQLQGQIKDLEREMAEKEKKKRTEDMIRIGRIVLDRLGAVSGEEMVQILDFYLRNEGDIED